MKVLAFQAIGSPAGYIGKNNQFTDVLNESILRYFAGQPESAQRRPQTTFVNSGKRITDSTGKKFRKHTLITTSLGVDELKTNISLDRIKVFVILKEARWFAVDASNASATLRSPGKGR